MIGLGVQGSLSQQHSLLLGGYTHLIIEGVVPDLFHVILVDDDAIFNELFEGQDATLAVGLIAHVAVLLPLPTMTSWCWGHLTMEGNTAREGWGVIPSEAGFARARATVNNKHRALFFHSD